MSTLRRRHIPYRRNLKSRAQGLRRNAPRPELKLWYEFLRSLPLKFTRQKPLGSYIADFYCSEKRLVIELDGDTHFNDDAMRRDARRTKTLAVEGIRVIRFTNLEVMEEFDAVCARIEELLATS